MIGSALKKNNKSISRCVNVGNFYCCLKFAADCGAGVGRVTKNLLIRYFNEVSLASFFSFINISISFVFLSFVSVLNAIIECL